MTDEIECNVLDIRGTDAVELDAARRAGERISLDAQLRSAAPGHAHDPALILTLDGETIVKAVPDIGYLHSGFEKLGEDLDFNQYVTIVDRMNYISPVANEIAWHHAVEKLMGIELTPRCKYIRTILAELMRISDHLLCVRGGGARSRRFTAFLYAFNQREKIYDIFEIGVRPALPSELLARRRPDGRRRRTSRSNRSATSSRVSQGARGRRAAAEPQPHLRRPHQGHRRACRRKRRSIELHRPDRPRQRRRPRSAQGRAVPGLSRISDAFKVVCAQGRRLLTRAIWSAWRR